MRRKISIQVSRIIQMVEQLLRGYHLLRIVLVVLWHLVGVAATYWLAFALRFDGHVPPNFVMVYLDTVFPLVAVCFLSFLGFRIFSDIWGYYSIDDLFRLGLSLVVSISAFALLVMLFRGWSVGGFPRSIFILEFLLLGMWVAGGRLAGRFLLRFQKVPLTRAEAAAEERLLLVGTLAEADIIIREAKRKSLGRIIGVVGDDTGRQNLYLHGIQVFHRRLEEIGALVREVNPDSVLILPPYNRPQMINDIMGRVSDSGVLCKFRTIPSLGELASGRLTASSIRDVRIEDMLSRGAVILDRTEVRRFIKGKKVMITGAGGSIGAELTRQVASYEPALIVLFEQSEPDLYRIEQTLKGRYPTLDVLAMAGDIRQVEDLRRAMTESGGVDVIYHAAAYKHVPLMEKNVPACFRTNVLGTARLAEEAVKAGVDRFVMISSDKAVRPSSIMGATKRLAERCINEMPCGKTTFVSVRFGNVLGSSGSVIPLFKRQIRNGGPVTVTTPEMRRFFMTIPEAVDLVLQAGVVGRNHDVMVLEMGEEVKIVDMARRLIELSGLIPDKDIKIVFTGLRPGEKEYEEVMTEDENVIKTDYEKIWVMKKNEKAEPESRVDLNQIESLVRQGDQEGLRRLACKYIPENFLTPDKKKA